MAETTADVRRDIELTRERMSDTISQLESKLNIMQTVRDHPWPALGAAAAAGFLLSGSGADVKAATAVGGTVAVTKSTGSRLGPMLDDLLGKVMLGVQDVLQQKADELVEDLRRAVGTPARGSNGAGGTMAAGQGTSGSTGSRSLADMSHTGSTGATSPSSTEPWAPTSPSSGTSGAAYGGEHRAAGESGTGPAYGSNLAGGPPRAD